MSQKTTKHRFGGASILASVLVLGLAWATVAQAQYASYSLSGNSRAQIGDGLPLPVTFQPAPNGAVQVPAGATVMQTAGPDPKAMKFTKQPSPFFSTTMATIGLHLLNKALFQVRTSLIVNGPAAGTAVFAAGGRSGPPVFSWCPGQPLPFTVNPGCLNGLTGGGTAAPFKARMRYASVANQFGGVLQASVGGGTKGGASVVLNVGVGAPCKHVALGGPDANCLGAFSPVAVDPTGVGGGALGTGTGDGFLSNPNPPAAIIHPVNVAANGIVISAGPAGGAIPANGVLSYGAPYTTGNVTVTANTALGAPEIFVLAGSDNRVDGIGSISLVSGGLSTRVLSGANANRGWLNYTVDAFSVPAISNGGLVLLSALMVAATAWMVRRVVVTSN